MVTSEERTAASRSSETKASSIHSARTDESDATRSSLSVPIPDNEYERIEALYRYAILDTAPELPFDRLTRRAAELLAAPVAVISFIDRDREWAKSCYGLPVRQLEISREVGFCAYTLVSDQPLIVPDTQKNERFRSNLPSPARRISVSISACRSQRQKASAWVAFVCSVQSRDPVQILTRWKPCNR
jgi:hypothetical protein